MRRSRTGEQATDRQAASRPKRDCIGCGEQFLVDEDERICKTCLVVLTEERKRLTDERRRAWARQWIENEEAR